MVINKFAAAASPAPGKDIIILFMFHLNSMIFKNFHYIIFFFLFTITKKYMSNTKNRQISIDIDITPGQVCCGFQVRCRFPNVAGNYNMVFTIN